ncbi:PTS system mannose/fructose/sorbose family transporter subunit IID [Enterococcus raffinosus]|uniref:PTS system mannose/fructose/sorbose-specific IID component n=1 Tax=Enterococcus raffinosus ATCC 49464 TaxID=1158602 RepID=R2R2W4_9ENTE|nr:PTS system mannose/fructose/sorbose family transporter subunit IID [Enterococcus raffinosus]EOH74991.1 hypothetical protein UAK_03855 [Enterococcus raffinosus ATCC 49464]EOT82170.1 hypothetical protein I590_00595 [Enterococcus raffinosus ATCC 49464]OJG84626.1 hypothetical protein RV13_GL001748 [Enterococcus raffinosus]UXK04582.1 PTS system mannose/fructose/sorbose family transporter subunit IID [Enterococcus raffinosus]
MEETKIQTVTQEKLTKKELNAIWRRFAWSFPAAASWERMLGMQYSWSLIPLFKKFYNKAGQADGMRRHSTFFNTESVFGSVIWGVITAMEEQKAINNNVDDDLIETTKISLMGPLAGVGDAMNPGMIIPLLLSIAIAFSEGGSPLGAIFYMVTYTAIVTIIMKFLFFKGYGLGVNGINTLIGEKANKIKNAIILFGTMIMGGVAASYVNLSLTLAIPSGNDQVMVQDLLDGIFPKIVPLALVLGTWWVMKKKKISTLQMILIYLVGIFVLSFFRIIGYSTGHHG